MSKSPEFLIEGILPANEIHLLAGSSGAGKTTGAFQQLAEYQQGKDVLGHKVNVVPLVYISLDRSRASVMRTLHRLSLEKEITRMVCQEDVTETGTVGAVMKEGLKAYPDSKLIVVEGFQTLAGDRGNGYGPVSTLLRATSTLCAKRKITILGICHAPKMKSDESFRHPRENILGSGAWGAYSDTVVTMDLDEKTGIITVHVLPRNAASEEHSFIFGLNGKLEAAVKGSPKDTLRIRISALPAGCTLMTSELMEMGRKIGAGDSTIKRVIAEAAVNKTLIRVEEGIYTRSSRAHLQIVETDEFKLGDDV